MRVTLKGIWFVLSGYSLRSFPWELVKPALVPTELGKMEDAANVGAGRSEVPVWTC